MLAIWSFTLLFDLSSSQDTTAICGAGYDWMNNAQGKSICEVASTLLGTCYPTPPYELAALDQGWEYPGPTIENNSTWYTWNQCLCSMPVYNALAACEDCQARSYTSWSGWTQSCNSSFTGVSTTPSLTFPQSMPNNLSVPSWVFIDSSLGTGTWSEAAANENATATTQSSSASSSNSQTSTSSSATSSSSTGGSKNSSGSSNNTGAIAGGIVGGLAALGILGAGAYYYFHRKRISQASIVNTGSPYSQADLFDPHQSHPSPAPTGSYMTERNSLIHNTSPPFPATTMQRSDGTAGYVPELVNEEVVNLNEPDIYPGYVPGGRV